jgi:DNA-binding response OmpR family regulator
MKSVTTILFVENDAVALAMYSKRLQREGFHVEIAEDGIAALKVLSEMTPDVVVLDLMLPKFSGRDVFDYMRADAQFKDIPVIIFSNASRADWPKDVDSGPTRALPKSEANFSALLELIREMSAASAAVANAQAEAAPKLQPAAVLPTESNTSTANGFTPPSDDPGVHETVNEFLEYAVAEMPIMREQCLAFIKAPATETGRNNLSTLKQRLHALNAGAQKAGCARLSLLASAWESMLAEIERRPAAASPSILQTLAQAADCLRILLNHNGINSVAPLPKARVLTVDDDEICNHVSAAALQRANMDADSVQDATAALDLLSQTNYDLVLLDINMPALTGFQLCEKLRALPNHKTTPVIFVTAFNNFENRKQSVLSGGGDLIAKPVSPLELALKVTIHLLKAPPKMVPVPLPVPVANINGEFDSELVWKEPDVTISHDTEMFLRGVNTLNAAPSVAAAITETRTSDPEAALAETPAAIAATAIVSPAIPLPAPEPEADTVLENILPSTPQPVAPQAATPLPIEQIAPPEPAAPAAAPAVELPTETVEAPVLESVAMSRALPDEGKVVPTQPPVTSETAVPISNGSSNERQVMTKENNPQFDTLVLDVAHIIFGDNAPEINVRLVRMALEQVWQNRANLQSLDAIAREIARIIFGETNTSDLNVRLVRMALERSNSIALFKAA